MENKSIAPELRDDTPGARIERGLAKVREVFSAHDEKLKSQGGDLEGIKQQMTELRDELKGLGDGAPTKVESGEVKSMIDGQIAAQMKAISEDVQRRIDSMEIKAQQTKTSVVEPGVNDIASIVLGNDEVMAQMREMRSQRRAGYTKSIRIPGIVGPRSIKDILGSSELEALTPRARRVATVAQLTEATDIASLVPRVGLGGKERYEYARQKEEGRLGSVATTLADVTATGDADMDVVDANGIIDGSLVRVFQGATTKEFFVSVAGNTLTLFTDPTLSTPTTFGAPASSGGERVTTEDYGATAEEAAKPQGWDEYEEVELALKTLAQVLTVTQQRLDAVPGFQSFVERELVMRARRNMSRHLLYGDGTATQLDGLASETGAQAYLWSSGQTGDTRADAIFRAADQIHVDDGQELTVAMKKDDWTKLLTLKASDGHYVHTNRGPVAFSDQPGARFIGTHRVVRDGKVREGDFFLAAWQLASEWPDSETDSIMLGFINDDFIKNIVRVRQEMKIGHAILRTSAYTLGNWDSQP
jgi:hypothetical protein